MATLGTLVRKKREQLDMTVTELASRTDMTKSYLSMIENDRLNNPPSLGKLKALERALGIRDGELRRTADWVNTPRAIKSDVRKFRKLVKALQAMQDLDEAHRVGKLQELIAEAAEQGDEEAKTDENIVAGVKTPHRVPIINKVAAGYPTGFTDLDFPAQVADDYVDVPDVSDPDAFGARVVGDSMIPDYREGDIVIFSPLADVTDGSDCFARLEPDHETTFKRVFFEQGGRIRLEALNKRYQPKVYDREQVAGLYRAVWKMSQL